jgi:hypothetical protein
LVLPPTVFGWSTTVPLLPVTVRFLAIESLKAAGDTPGWQEKLDVGIATYFRWMAEHPEVAVTTVVEVHSAGRRALAARSEALKEWRRTLQGVAYLARKAGVPVEIDEAPCSAIILTAEAYVHEYARQGRLEQVVEKTAAVQQLSRTLFECSVVKDAAAEAADSP